MKLNLFFFSPFIRDEEIPPLENTYIKTEDNSTSRRYYDSREKEREYDKYRERERIEIREREKDPRFKNLSWRAEEGNYSDRRYRYQDSDYRSADPDPKRQKTTYVEPYRSRDPRYIPPTDPRTSTPPIVVPQPKSPAVPQNILSTYTPTPKTTPILPNNTNGVHPGTKLNTTATNRNPSDPHPQEDHLGKLQRELQV